MRTIEVPAREWKIYPHLGIAQVLSDEQPEDDKPIRAVEHHDYAFVRARLVEAVRGLDQLNQLLIADELGVEKLKAELATAQSTIERLQTENLELRERAGRGL